MPSCMRHTESYLSAYPVAQTGEIFVPPKMGLGRYPIARILELDDVPVGGMEFSIQKFGWESLGGLLADG